MLFPIDRRGLLQLNKERFDFNIEFERLFFSIIPSVVFISTAAWRALSQARKPVVVKARVFQLIKVSAIATYAVLELALLVLVALSALHATATGLAASVLGFVSAIFMILLSLLDHSRSPRPSLLLSAYLSLTLLLDAAQVRTLFLSSASQSESHYSNVFCSAVAVKAVVLILESKQKTSWINWNKKDHSPEETSGIFSLGIFFWLNNIFWLGYKKVLSINDLYPLDSALEASSLHDAFSSKMDYSELRGDKLGLVKVLVRTLWKPLLLPILPRLMLLGFTLCQPLFMEKLLRYLSQSELDANNGYGFIGASLLIYLGIAISSAIYWYFHNRARTMIRSILVTEVFFKATEAGIGGPEDSAALTLMSTDMERIRVGIYSLHEVWACMIQAALAAWMLYIRLGAVFIAPIAVVLVFFTILGFLMSFIGRAQTVWMAAVQKRVGLTASVISSMKNVKISGLSAPVSQFVQRLRVEELAAGARFRQLYIAAAALGFLSQLIGPPITFAFTQQTLDASTMFTALAFISLLTAPMSAIFEGVPTLISALACLRRIQAFLECETRQDYRMILSERRKMSEKTSVAPDPATIPVLAVEHGSFGWTADELVLRNINVQILKSSLTVVVGPVGSGKSTFCKALLGETPISEGSVTANLGRGHVGFCDQTAFLSNGSIRDNIIGFSPYDSQRYTEVINATALDVDFTTLSQGDRTNVGSDGITLSGGQKQRVSLARALYLQSDLLVLDDVFSGLDADTEERVFQQVFAPGGILRRRSATVVLCTHSTKHLPAGDYILVLGDGTVAEQGTFRDLATSAGYVQRLELKELSESKASSPSSTTNQLSTAQVSHISTKDASDLTPGTEQSRQVGDRTVYKHYAKSLGWFLTGLSVFFAVLWGLFTNFPTIWLTYWVDDISSKAPVHSYAYWVGLYALFQMCAMLSLLALAITLWVVGIKKAGANIHIGLLQTLIHAPLRFFTKTDTGTVTNLFSQDLNLIDTELPEATLNTFFCIAQTLGQAAVMLVSSVYLAIAYPFLAAILYVVGRFYLRTSRQLRLLDLEAKSPLYTHFLDTVKGITTHRAFGFISEDIYKNVRLLNTSQRPAYLLLMIQEWLKLVLALIVMVIAVVLVTLSIQLHSKSAFAGAALYSLITLGENLAGIVLFYTKLETSIGAISRVRTFNDTVKPEDRVEEDIAPPEQWPDKGMVVLNGVNASYDVEDEENSTPNLALCNIHLTVQAGEKIAICGRTGSGKSSLVAFLLKLLDPTSSTAADTTIDDIPLHRINRSTLRQHIIAVPQEAVFLPDGTTFQTNLDPENFSSPEECEAVLETVGLWTFVVQRGGLAAGMSPGTLSAGQQQLMSVGRALLRHRVRARQAQLQDQNDPSSHKRGGLLLLDEVSSSVDRETERVIQDIITTEFANYTVIAVSHRLEMVMDFDRVVVMDAGEIVEVGKPRMLAEEADTRFGALVRADKA